MNDCERAQNEDSCPDDCEHCQYVERVDIEETILPNFPIGLIADRIVRNCEVSLLIEELYKRGITPDMIRSILDNR